MEDITLLSTTGQSLDREMLNLEFIEKILDVSRPYMAFSRVTIDSDEQMVGCFDQQYPLGQESGPLAGAETGRHVAILCSAAVANLRQDRGKEYYLVTAATFVRLEGAETISRTGTLSASASVTSMAKREAQAHGYVWDENGTAISRLDVRFTILAEKLFNRTFGVSAERVPMVLDYNPYLNPPELKAVTLDAEHSTMRADYGPVGAARCIGHFDAFAAVPLSLLLLGVSHLGGRFALAIDGNESGTFSILHAEVEADVLPVADDKIEIIARDAKALGEGVYSVFVGAYVGERQCCQLELRVKSIRR